MRYDERVLRGRWLMNGRSGKASISRIAEPNRSFVPAGREDQNKMEYMAIENPS